MIKFPVLGKDGNYQVATDDVPVTGVFVVDAPLAMTGQCCEARFPGPPPNFPACTFTSGEVALRCE